MTDQEISDVKEKRYEYYVRRTDFYRNYSVEISKSLDDKLVYVSGGAITASLAFLGLENLTLDFKGLLIASWLCFILTIIFVVICQRLVLRHNLESGKKLDVWLAEQMAKGEREIVAESGKAISPDTSSKWKKLNTHAFSVCSNAFVLGFVFLVLFIYLNLK